MCFAKKQKLSEPKITTPQINQAPPIEDQTPKLVDGADMADSERSKRRKANPNSSLSMFQIQLMPGATTTSGDEPGASGALDS